MTMIRPRKIFIIVTILGFWMLATYILVTNKAQQNEMRRKMLMKKIEDLENDVRDKVEERKYLKDQIMSILKTKAVVAGPYTTPLSSSISSGSSSSVIPEVVESPQPPPSPLDIYTSAYLDDEQKIPVIPVLVFACNRPSVSKCLDNLTKYRPNREMFPIIVSQDCGDKFTRDTILKYKDDVTLIEQPDLSDIQVEPKDKKFQGYYKISRHYGWALNQVFGRKFEFVIIVEDDLNVSPDFFEYFQATYPLLRNDSSLWCISAWNDNGKTGLINENRPDLLYRTDFFPGLGWMLTNTLWAELSVKWPKAFWDDWIRTPQQRKDRACIRPEVSRTQTFGKIGVSNGLFYEKHLKLIKLSEKFVHFTQKNLSYLLKDNYDNTFLTEVYQTPVYTFEEIRRGLVEDRDSARIQYNTKEQYKRITKLMGLMDDFRSGVPRTAYHGIVTFYYRNLRVHLAPNINWKGYDPSWS